jgi:Flp pilus assembly protein TadG
MKKMEGQSIVETALVAPLFLLLLFMIIDVGRITYSLSRLNFVCQETVRLAGLGNGNTQVEEYARSKVDSVAVNISPAEETLRKPGTFVTVTLDARLDYITPFANVILPSPFHAKAESTIRVE